MTFWQALGATSLGGLIGYVVCAINVTITMKRQGAKAVWWFGPWRIWG